MSQLEWLTELSGMLDDASSVLKASSTKIALSKSSRTRLFDEGIKLIEEVSTEINTERETIIRMGEE